MNKLSFAIIAILITSLACSCSPKKTEHSNTLEGSIDRVEGVCEGKIALDERPEPLFSGNSLLGYEWVKTGASGKMALKFSGGGTIYLGTDTEIIFKENDTIALRGEIAGFAQTPLFLELASGKVKIYKGDFYASSKTGKITEIKLISGAASVKPEMRENWVTIPAGTQTRITTSATPKPELIPSASALSEIISFATDLGFSPMKTHLPADLNISVGATSGEITRGRLALRSEKGDVNSIDFEKESDVFVVVSPGTYVITLEAEGFSSKSINLALSAGDIKSISIELDPAEKQPETFLIEGRVQTKDGLPIENALVTFRGISCSTNPGGRFELKPAEPITEILTVRKEGFRLWARELSPEKPESKNMTITLIRIPKEKSVEMGELLVFVMDEKGAPVMGATVRARAKTNMLDVRNDTSKTGSAYFSELLEGEYSIVVDKDGYNSSDETIEIKNGKTTEVIMTLRKN